MLTENYPRKTVERLVEGAVPYLMQDPLTPGLYDVRWFEAEPSALEVRAWVEHMGHIDSEVAAELWDLDRAMLALRSYRPLVAAYMELRMAGWEPWELDKVIRIDMPHHKIMSKGKAFIRAFLNEGTMRAATAAYRRAKEATDGGTGSDVEGNGRGPRRRGASGGAVPRGEVRGGSPAR